MLNLHYRNGDPIYADDMNDIVAAIQKNRDDIDYKMANEIVQITYAELVELRDNSNLSVGTTYRITDYDFTTTLENTSSAHHIFDILVTADSHNKLNENAHALPHEGDTYFDGCKLNEWQLRYSLDNDITRFIWADATTVLMSYDLVFMRDKRYDNLFEYCRFIEFEGVIYRPFFQRWKDGKYEYDDQGEHNNIYLIDEFPTVGSKIYDNEMTEIGEITDSSQIIPIKQYAWILKDIPGAWLILFTDSTTPNVGDIVDLYTVKEESFITDIDFPLDIISFHEGNGKGVIYYMKDDNNNVGSYDFKNGLVTVEVEGQTFQVYGYTAYDLDEMTLEDATIGYNPQALNNNGEIFGFWEKDSLDNCKKAMYIPTHFTPTLLQKNREMFISDHRIQLYDN